jgi:hypothetical protein
MWVKESITPGELDALHKAASLAWSEKTRYPLTLSSNSDAGQCYVTACWLIDRLGGKLGKREGHYVWLSANEAFYIDLTGDHSSSPIYAENDGQFESTETVINNRASHFIRQANRAFETLPELLKMGYGYVGDAYPGDTPQRQLEREQYYHDEPSHHPHDANQSFVYANGDIVVADEDHEAILEKMGLGRQIDGPHALGVVNIEGGQAVWKVQTNIDLKAFSDIAKDYSHHVGWRFAGITDLDGFEVAPFTNKKATTIHYLAKADGEIIMGKSNHAELFRQSNVDRARFGSIKVVGDKALMDPILPEAVQGVYEWADDNGIKLFGRNPLGGPDYELDNMGTDKGEIEKTEEEVSLQDLSRDPSGIYRCPSCEAIFPDWHEYQEHRKQEEGNAEELKAPAFPKNDMDATFPTHFTEQPPRIMPVARNEAARVDGFKGGEEDDEYFVSYHCGSPIGYIRMAKGRIVAFHMAKEKEGWEESLLHFAKKYSGKEPKDLLADPVPFIFDTGNYQLAVGQPGQTTSEVAGDFTKGGIIEGVYEPGGKMTIRPSTDLPFTTYAIIQKWYTHYPELSVTGIDMRDSEGKTVKLA